MLKLKRYLKPYVLFLVCGIALLFGQAMLELELPNYMSNIVNIGIQDVYKRQFEMFVEMYGLPSYGDLDPTPFVALTYSIQMCIRDRSHTCRSRCRRTPWRSSRRNACGPSRRGRTA